MTIKEKEKAYDEAYKVAENIHRFSSDPSEIKRMEEIFPELKESEDERIRKELIAFLKENHETGRADETWSLSGIERWIAWLEKQGGQKPYGQRQECVDCQFNYAGECKGSCAIKRDEQMPVDNRLIPQKGEYYVCIKDYYSADGKTTNTKGKIYKSPCAGYINDDKGFGLSWINSYIKNHFRPVKEEDWIVCEQNNVVGKPLQYKEFMSELIQKDIKTLEDKGIVPNFRLWTIQDAKDSDVLVCVGKHGQEIGVVKESVGKYGGCDKCFETYCFVDWDGIFRTGEYMGSKEIYPATKEQRDLLFQKMKDAGYEWDAEKKKLKKMEQKPAWSEEDEKAINIALSLLRDLLSENIYPYFSKSFVRAIKVLESLKDRVQPKQKWSEEDEKHIESILKRLDGMCKKGATFTITCFAVNQDMDWLKSIKDKM